MCQNPEQKVDSEKFELFEKCGNETHDYCCCDYEDDYMGHEDECNPVVIVTFECGCKAYDKEVN